MTIYRIPPPTADLLIEQPESGMGYQVIRHANDLLFVFNATIAVAYKRLQARDFDLDTLALFGGDPDEVERSDLEPLFLSEPRLAYSDFLPDLVEYDVPIRGSDIVGAPDPARLGAPQPVSYYRFSSYTRDRRVDPKTGDFAPGTYATTFTDLPFSPSGYAAVGRFALPNPAPARYVFPIVTLDLPNLMGTATPNYGQAGGGVEVFFGTGAGTAVGEGFRIETG